jgi:AcrR family transcriptional regulator
MILQAQDGRTRKKLEAMRRVQDAAIALFEARGFDAVTVEEVAREADVGVASVFRNFGSKEQLVLWDEYDPLLFDALAKKLADKRPLAAIEAALVESLGTLYARDRKRVLRRADLIAQSAALQQAARAGIQALREGLVGVLATKLRDPFERELVAAVFATALEVAVERWRVERARRPLASHLKRAFLLVARLG